MCARPGEDMAVVPEQHHTATAVFRSEWFWTTLLPYCSWEERFGSLLMCKWDADTVEDFWSLLCMRLASERHLTLMPRRFFGKIKVGNAKEYFWQLWSLRNRFFLHEESMIFVDVERVAPYGLRYSTENKSGWSKKSFVLCSQSAAVAGEGSETLLPKEEEDHEVKALGTKPVSLNISTCQAVKEQETMKKQQTIATENAKVEDEDASSPVVVVPQVLQTVCRFRPSSCFKETAENTATSNKVTIPLHQRVALLREKGYSKLQAQQKALEFERALHAARKQENADLEALSAASTTASSGDSEYDNKPSCPASASTAASKYQLRASVLNYTKSEVFTLCPGVGAKRYEFDTVFGDKSATGELFELALPLINSFLNGEDSCIFSYGQTGSGKTFTMFGKDEETTLENLRSLALAAFPAPTGVVNVYGRGPKMVNNAGTVVLEDEGGNINDTCKTPSEQVKREHQHDQKTAEDALVRVPVVPLHDGPERSEQMEILSATTGLIPQTLLYLLRRKPHALSLTLSFVEVFGNTVRDLLTGEVVHSLVSDPPTERDLNSVADIYHFLHDGAQHKRAAATAMNAKSTRAHAVVLVKLRTPEDYGALAEAERYCPINKSSPFYVQQELLGHQVDQSQSSSSASSSRRPAPGVVEDNYLRKPKNKPPRGPVCSQLILLDLGGSEKLERSRVHEDVRAPGGFVSGDQVHAETTWKEYYKSRTRVQETAFINLGLLSLKRCIAALLETNENGRVQTEQDLPRIPFYDSKLTQIMRPSLLSRNLLCVICAGAEDANAVESIASLRFGENCRQLGGFATYLDKTKQQSGNALSESVRVLDLRIQEVQKEIKKKERWEWREIKRSDVVDAMDTNPTQLNTDEEMELGGKGAVEIFADDGNSKKETITHTVQGQVLVGAEQENELLAKLLDQRRMLLGEE